MVIKQPDNTKLLELLDLYWKAEGRGDSYENVIKELIDGNSFLMIPTVTDPDQERHNWKTATIVHFEGRKAIRVFTDEGALLRWMKKLTTYAAMRSQDVLKLCQANGFTRVIINSGCANTFVIEGLH